MESQHPPKLPHPHPVPRQSALPRTTSVKLPVYRFARGYDHMHLPWDSKLLKPAPPCTPLSLAAALASVATAPTAVPRAPSPGLSLPSTATTKHPRTALDNTASAAPAAAKVYSEYPAAPQAPSYALNKQALPAGSFYSIGKARRTSLTCKPEPTHQSQWHTRTAHPATSQNHATLGNRAGRPSAFPVKSLHNGRRPAKCLAPALCSKQTA